MGDTDTNGKPVKSSADSWWGWNTIYGMDGSPYMTRAWIGRLRFHIFHRGDLDPDHHDHPWDFTTFPLTSYVEEVAVPIGKFVHKDSASGKLTVGPREWRTKRVLVHAFRPHFRPATHMHRVLGRYAGWDKFPEGQHEYGRWLDDPFYTVPVWRPGKIVTIVWRSKPKRAWGFLKNRKGHWCWTDWKDYVFKGGKDAPCR